MYKNYDLKRKLKAVQYTGDNLNEVLEFCYYPEYQVGKKKVIFIHQNPLAHSDPVKLEVGHYLMLMPEGHFESMSEGRFTNLYEEVPSWRL